MQVENNRPSAQEQATADDKKRQSQNNKNNVSQARIGQQAGRAYQTKESKSAFDNVLDNLIQENLQTKPEESASAFESKFKEKVQEKEKPKERNESRRDKDSDSKTHRSESTEGSKNVKDLSLRQQVNAKQNSGGGSGGSSGGGQGGQQKGQGDSKQFSGGQGRFAALRTEANPGPANIAVPRVDSFSNIEKTQRPTPSSQIPKQVLDQIIQVIKVGMNKDDQKEIHLDLSEKIFRGLSLKVTSKNGKVEVSFITSDPQVKRLFESEKQNISEALQEKGVQLSQIQVKFMG
ncbi:MAG: flagellar hook-length control protein FliK [Deltaproteobacteria bacterium]|nr:flagellar hook-length control protein FliK [Deltaproteobacteria bacterium]